MAKSSKCPCGKVYCNVHFKVRMGFMLKNEYKEQNGGRNPYFYNFYKTNRQPTSKIIKDMARRFAPLFKGQYRYIVFYDSSNRLIERLTP